MNWFDLLGNIFVVPLYLAIAIRLGTDFNILWIIIIAASVNVIKMFKSWRFNLESSNI